MLVTLEGNMHVYDDAFAAYLTLPLKRVKLIELFAYWDGDQSVTPEHYHRLSPEALEDKDFFFQEKNS